jgi:hypothetical protein
MNDLEIAFAMERLILGGPLQASCNCCFEKICTMPYTFWVRAGKYLHHCPQHLRKRRKEGGGTLTSNRDAPFWFDTGGRLLSPEEFTAGFQLVVSGGATLVPGYVMDQGRTRVPSLLSMEGRHYIIESGKTEMFSHG